MDTNNEIPNEAENLTPISLNLEFENRINLSELTECVSQIKEQLQKVIVGQKEMIDLLIVSLSLNILFAPKL